MIKGKPRSLKAWPADIESYFSTDSSTQSTVHNNTTCDVLEALNSLQVQLFTDY